MTAWNAIKDRVELKVGERIEHKDFCILANEAISELNQSAYIEAPVKRYKGNEIKFKDEEHITTLSEMLDSLTDVKNSEHKLNDISTIPGGTIWIDYEYVLPFEYDRGYGDLVMTIPAELNKVISIREDEFDLNRKTDVVIVSVLYRSVNKVANDAIAELRKDIDMAHKEINFTKKIIRVENNKFTSNCESVITLPENFSSLTKLEVVDIDGNAIKAHKTTVLALDVNDNDNYSDYSHIFYQHGNEIHIYSTWSILSVNLYYIRRMTNVNDKYALTEQYVDFGPNFENVMTLSIAYKWSENFLGTEDAGTLQLYKSYAFLKREFEETEAARRKNNRQKKITISY